MFWLFLSKYSYMIWLSLNIFNVLPPNILLQFLFVCVKPLDKKYMKTWFWEYGEPISHLCSYLPTANKYHKRISIALSWVQEMTTMCKFHQEHEWWKIAMSFCFRATIISILTEGVGGDRGQAASVANLLHPIYHCIGSIIHLYIISLNLAYL